MYFGIYRLEKAVDVIRSEYKRIETQELRNLAQNTVGKIY